MAATATDGSGEPPAKRIRTEGIHVPPGFTSLSHVEDWHELHKAEFAPPLRNGIIHKGQLSVMLLGGPSARKDFSMEEGSEFFYQMRGDIELITLQAGKRKLVQIKQGQVYCLPSRILHSLQRPGADSFGLVVERQRSQTEFDGLVVFRDFEKCDKVFWEKFFRCEHVTKDLPPVLAEFTQFEASADSKKQLPWPEDERPSRQDVTTEVPPPFFLEDFLLANKEKLDAGEELPLFGYDHPDREFDVMVASGQSEQCGQIWQGETWMYQIRGTSHVAAKSGTLTLNEGCCCVVQQNMSYDVVRTAGSIGLVVRMDPQGNKSQQADPVPN